MNIRLIAIIVSLYTTFIFAQNKTLNIEDVVLNSYSSLAAENLSQLSWIPNSEDLAFVRGDSLIKINSKTRTESLLIPLHNLKSSHHSNQDLKRFPKIKWVSENEISFWNGSGYYLYNLKENKSELVNKIPGTPEVKRVALNNKFTAYMVENNLFLSIDAETKLQITDEVEKGIVSGKCVCRNEFGINKGIFWSPKSNYLAFYQKDERNVTDYPLVEIGTAPAKVKNIKYPMAGQTSETLKIGIFNIERGKTIWLKTEGDIDQYLTNVTWDPTEKYIYVAHLNRDQDHLRLVKYNVENGEPVKTLFDEKDEEYVEPEHELQFICEDEDKFIWFSERDGWQHLYLYNTKGKLIKQITSGKWVVKNIAGIDNKNKVIYVIGTKDTPVEDHLYKVDIKTGKVSRLTELGASHKIDYNEKLNLFIDTYSSFSVPSVVQLIDSEGNILSKIFKSKNPISEYDISTPKILKLKGENDIDLYSRLILPVDFDSTKKYPVIVYVYGGPHIQLVTNTWYFGRYHFWFQYMAKKGYIIFTLDNRGSANRGLEFEQAVFGRLGTKEVEDQMVGVNYLKSLSYVDSTRIGVFGWSYGGFMTASLMLRTNDAFKVGVGGGAVIDWKLYEVMYGERYMDTPQKNPEGFEEANLLNYVQNLNGKLLLVHGTSDPTVVWENTLEFTKKAAQLNKPLDYYPYVGHGHGVRGRDAIHLYEKISQYFIDNL